jgi:hypothetical protein
MKGPCRPGKYMIAGCMRFSFAESPLLPLLPWDSHRVSESNGVSPKGLDRHYITLDILSQ